MEPMTQTQLPATPPGNDLDQSSSSTGRSVIIVLAAIVFGLFLTWVAAFVFLDFRTWWTPSESMAPTVDADDRIITWKLGDIERGDVVVHTVPERATNQVREVIKRVVALEGETISFEDDRVHINGQPLDEPYLDDDIFTVAMVDGPAEFTVPAGSVFVLGDNRMRSSDSRSYGPVSVDAIVSNNHWVWNSGG